MKIWLDDIRPMPEGYDIHVETVEEAIALLKEGKVTEISLDNDLGEGLKEGYEVAKYIEMAAYYGELEPISLKHHTDNSVARDKMEMAFENAIVFWERDEKL